MSDAAVAVSLLLMPDLCDCECRRPV